MSQNTCGEISRQYQLPVGRFEAARVSVGEPYTCEEPGPPLAGTPNPARPERVIPVPKPSKPLIPEPKPAKPLIPEPRPSKPLIPEPKPNRPVITDAAAAQEWRRPAAQG